MIKLILIDFIYKLSELVKSMPLIKIESNYHNVS